MQTHLQYYDVIHRELHFPTCYFLFPILIIFCFVSFSGRRSPPTYPPCKDLLLRVPHNSLSYSPSLPLKRSLRILFFFYSRTKHRAFWPFLGSLSSPLPPHTQHSSRQDVLWAGVAVRWVFLFVHVAGNPSPQKKKKRERKIKMRCINTRCEFRQGGDLGHSQAKRIPIDVKLSAQLFPRPMELDQSPSLTKKGGTRTRKR